MQSFSEENFKSKVNNALVKVKTILDNAKQPQYAATDVQHEYDDKYILSEFLASSAIASSVNALSQLGLSSKLLSKLKEWNKTRSVTLQFKAEEKCKFLRKVERDVESDTKHVSTSTIFGKSTSYTVTKVTEYFWQFDTKWELIAYQGNDPEKGEQLASRSGSIELKTSTETTPKPAVVVRPNIDVNISWLLSHLDDKANASFKIDRTAASCATPRRNTEIDTALGYFVSFVSWSERVAMYFNGTLFPVQSDHGLDLNSINTNSLFVPVLALFDKTHKTAAKKKDDKKDKKEKEDPASTVVPLSYINSFLEEQMRSINEKFAELQKIFPQGSKLISVAEAKQIVMLYHLKNIAQYFADGVDHIEDMLRKQLIAAIGKEVGPVDFSNYLRFHNRKLFRPAYQPKAFCYAIRRPDHYPEGILSIEAQQADGTLADPIQTTVSSSVATRPMKFTIDAATEVSFMGERHLHGFITHQFSGVSGQSLSLVARARQFSSFILMVGRIASAELFEPKYAIIIKDKDDLRLPLLLETIPTPKEFRDAIESLSPEQQRFAKAFRAMQLESTLFGVAVIQIKPQLEKVLRLPDDSLTKEIALTQDLLNLFIEYQIPSDLISYQGDETATLRAKVDTVKGYVKNMKDLIAEQKGSQLKEAQQKQEYRFAEMDRAVPPPRPMPSPMPVQSAMPMSRMAFGGGAPGGAPMPPSFSAPPSAPRMQSAPPPPPAAAAAASAPAPPPPEPSKPSEVKPSEPTGPKENYKVDDALVGADKGVDYTKIPNQLEKKYEELDVDGALRPTILNPGNAWAKKFQRSLLAEPESKTLSKDEQGKERNKAFDLLDALTKSGSLMVDAAALHVVIAATHCFDKTLMNTLVQANVNPIEKVERSSLIMASTIHGVSPKELIVAEHVERIAQFSPMLIADVPAEAAPSIASDKDKEKEKEKVKEKKHKH